MAVFLQILKILGIVLLCILGLVVLLLLLVLFVPIRYQVKGNRKTADDAPVRAKLKVNWLLHLLTVSFIYPEEAYLKVKVLGITVYSTQKKEGASDRDNPSKKKKPKETPKEEVIAATPTEEAAIEEAPTSSETHVMNEETDNIEEVLQNALEAADNEEEAKLWKFFQKLWQNIKNIKYTIQRIYDKIKEIIRNIRYYIRVIQSETFKRAFRLCKAEILKLLKSILPGKLNANLIIGTGEPASTGQILAIHGILYPYIGNHIYITPDFENAIVEGDFFIKGKITVFKALKMAIKVYFNKDIKRVIRLLNREAVTNGRK